MNTTV